MITLTNNGFEVIKSFFNPPQLVFNFNTNLQEIANISNSNDVFRGDGKIKQIQNLHKLDNKYLLLAYSLGELYIKQDYEILNMQYFIKNPDYKITAPHQDAAYFNQDGSDIITFWIPLQDVNEENSCMFYIPESHKLGLIEHKAIGTNIRTRTGKTGLSQYCDQYDLNEFEAVPMNLGDVLVHDQYCVHYSSTNKTNIPRVALTCIMKVK